MTVDWLNAESLDLGIKSNIVELNDKGVKIRLPMSDDTLARWKELPPHLKVVLQSLLDGMTFREIGVQLSVSAAQARQLCKEAERRLYDRHSI